MSRTATLLQLRTRARQRADMENTQFVSDAEANSLVNESLAELYDLLVGAYERYKITSSNVAVVAGTDTYALPATFYKLEAVDLILDSQGNAVTLLPAEFQERNNFLFTPSFSVIGLSYLRYILLGDNIKFVPVPQGAQTVKLWYTPSFTSLASDSDTFDGINGWEEYAVLDAAIKMMQKEESDVSSLEFRKAALLKRLNSMKQARDAGKPFRVNDVSRTQPWETLSFGNFP